MRGGGTLHGGVLWWPLLFVLGATTTSCRHVADPVPVHVGTPVASVTAEAIIERYQNDPELADELYVGNRVHIKQFRVKKSGSMYLRMKANGYTLRLSQPPDAQKIRKGDVIRLYCVGKGLRADEKMIVFKECRGRLEED